MGELLLCTESITSMPYYIEGMSLNIYSLEELSYFILNNTYMIERDFMCEELCTWIEKSVKRQSLAEELRDIKRGEGTLSSFIGLILKDCGYCTVEEQRLIISILTEMEEKSDFECNKIRADRLLERDKILSAIYEYKRLLDMREAMEQPRNLIGNIWHNLGACYGRLFLFEEAISCFEKAYKLNQDKESLKEMLLAYRCRKDEAGFIRVAMENDMADIEMQELRNELTIASRDDRTIAFENRLEEIASMTREEDKEVKRAEISRMILEWKEDYRRISRV